MTFLDDSRPSIRYPVAILAKCMNPDAAKFLAVLKAWPTCEIFQRLGYVTLGAK